MPKFYNPLTGDEVESDTCPSGYGLRRRLHLSDAAPAGARIAGYQHFNPYSVVADAAALDDREQAYRERSIQMADAWRHQLDATKKLFHSPPAAPTASDAQAVRDSAYEEHCRWLASAWKGSPHAA